MQPLLKWWVITAVLFCLGADRPETGRHSTVLVLGDSISAAYGIQREQGWVQLLEERLANIDPGYRVVNASISGDTTGGGLARLPAALETHDPALVIIELGGNDGLRGYPVPSIRKNLEQLVELAADDGREVLLVGMQIPPNYGYRYTRDFQSLFEDVASDQGIAVVPSFLEEVGVQPGLMQDDGIHPNASAQPMLLDALWPFVETLLFR
ncbi:MAG: arylesterase [Gammaproteobacteria bacterium]|nr:arylesterase [Gammaproteobacteria bacterium]